jgi:hypothetical protein
MTYVGTRGVARRLRQVLVTEQPRMTMRILILSLKVKVRLHRMQRYRFHFALPRAERGHLVGFDDPRRSLAWLGCFAVASSDHTARCDFCDANDFPPLRPALPRPARPNRPDDGPRSYIGCGMSVRAPLSSRFRGPFSIMRRRSTSRRGSDFVPIPLDSDYPGPALAVKLLGHRVLNVGQQLLGCIE